MSYALHNSEERSFDTRRDFSRKVPGPHQYKYHSFIISSTIMETQFYFFSVEESSSGYRSGTNGKSERVDFTRVALESIVLKGEQLVGMNLAESEQSDSDRRPSEEGSKKHRYLVYSSEHPRGAPSFSGTDGLGRGVTYTEDKPENVMRQHEKLVGVDVGCVTRFPGCYMMIV